MSERVITKAHAEYLQTVSLTLMLTKNYQGDVLRNIKRDLPDWDIASYNNSDGKAIINLVCRNYLTDEGTDRASVEADGKRIRNALEGMGSLEMVFQSKPNKVKLGLARENQND